MEKDIVFLYGWGPEEEGRLSALLYLVETAAAMDMKTTVFLFTDGVVLARKGASGKMSTGIQERLDRLLDNRNIQFCVCEQAAKKRGITKDNMENGMVITGYATFLDTATSTKTVITV